jgi:hypothetical protein
MKISLGVLRYRWPEAAMLEDGIKRRCRSSLNHDESPSKRAYGRKP